MDDPKCPKCGAGVSEHRLCPKQSYKQANVGGVGWRQVPNRVQDCIQEKEGADRLKAMIVAAYGRYRAESRDNAKWQRFKTWNIEQH